MYTIGVYSKLTGWMFLKCYLKYSYILGEFPQGCIIEKEWQLSVFLKTSVIWQLCSFLGRN